MTDPLQWRAMAATSGSSAFRTAIPSRGPASTTTPLTPAGRRHEGVARRGGAERVVRVQDRDPVARHGLDDDAFDLGELANRVDASESEMVAGHVQHDRDVVAVVAEARAQDRAGREPG